MIIIHFPGLKKGNNLILVMGLRRYNIHRIKKSHPRIYDFNQHAHTALAADKNVMILFGGPERQHP